MNNFFYKPIIGVIVVTTIIFYSSAAYFISGFEELFYELEPELPLKTRSLLKVYHIWIIIDFLCVWGGYLLIYKDKKHGWWFIGIPAISIFFTFPFIVWALYGPIIKLG